MTEKNKYDTLGEEATKKRLLNSEDADASQVDENTASLELTDGICASDSDGISLCNNKGAERADDSNPDGDVNEQSEHLTDSKVEDASDESLPYAHISEDGDQLTLSIPAVEQVQNDADNKNAAPSDEPVGFAATILKEAPPYDEKKPRRIDERFDFIELLLFTLAVVFVMTSFLFRHSIVDGNSMQNTLQDGEVLIISNLFYTPQRYDIVVVEDYSTGLDHPIVKRVIATEGETVKITSNGKIFVDGNEIKNYFVFTDVGDFNGDGADDYTYTPMEYTVPKGEIFVLGDHRNDSYDSRKFGGVDADAVLGKVLFRIYPFNRFGSVYSNAEE